MNFLLANASRWLWFLWVRSEQHFLWIFSAFVLYELDQTENVPRFVFLQDFLVYGHSFVCPFVCSSSTGHSSQLSRFLK